MFEKMNTIAFPLGLFLFYFISSQQDTADFMSTNSINSNTLLEKLEDVNGTLKPKGAQGRKLNNHIPNCLAHREVTKGDNFEKCVKYVGDWTN